MGLLRATERAQFGSDVSWTSAWSGFGTPIWLCLAVAVLAGVAMGVDDVLRRPPSAPNTAGLATIGLTLVWAVSLAQDLYDFVEFGVVGDHTEERFAGRTWQLVTVVILLLLVVAAVSVPRRPPRRGGVMMGVATVAVTVVVAEIWFVVAEWDLDVFTPWRLPILLVPAAALAWSGAQVRAISCSSKVSIRSPGLRSWKSERPMPHSKPSRTSRASSLNRLSEAISPFQMIVPSRRKRTFEPAGDHTRAHVAAGDGADARHPEDLADLGLAGDDLFVLGGEHADHRLLDVLEQLVDDLVGADLDVLGVGQLARLAVGPHVEADDRGVRGGGQRDVGLGDAADAAVHERQLDLGAVELAQALGDGLERAVDVGLEHRGSASPSRPPGSGRRCPPAWCRS